MNQAKAKEYRILLAEDNIDNQFLIRAYLKDTPFHLVIAGTGEEAVEKFKETRYDLVLMDLHMPVMDGYEAAKAIRHWEAGQMKGQSRFIQVPIIALSASVLKEDIEKSFQVGCTDHLMKPIRKNVLMKTLRHFLNIENFPVEEV
ncbi:MAG: response regulator [Candidatus Omnitrophica bacterium]|nr:response regulator [Candidatus Omnitrophota bacterium]